MARLMKQVPQKSGVAITGMGVPINRGSISTVVNAHLQLPALPTFIRHFQQHGCVIAKSVLPERTCSEWGAQAVRLWREYGRTINKPGRPGGTELRYEVVTGEDVEKKWPDNALLSPNHAIEASPRENQHPDGVSKISRRFASTRS